MKGQRYIYSSEYNAMNNYCREELVQIIQSFACALHDDDTEWAKELGDKYYDLTLMYYEAERDN
jgi:hypothetical protein